jgi:hypothetical protein
LTENSILSAARVYFGTKKQNNNKSETVTVSRIRLLRRGEWKQAKCNVFYRIQKAGSRGEGGTMSKNRPNWSLTKCGFLPGLPDCIFSTRSANLRKF